MRVLLVAEAGQARDRYMAALRSLHVDADETGSIGDLNAALAATPYSGVLLDVPTMVKAAAEEKASVYDLLELFPVARLRWDETTGEIRALFFGSKAPLVSLGEFIERECTPFSPRTIRAARRGQIHYSALLSATPDMDGAERTSTINISERGMFVYSTRDWSDMAEAYAVLMEMEDKTPIRLAIRWHAPWGTAMRLPGIGASFLGLTPAQLREIRDMLES